MSLLREIQVDVANPRGDVTSALRKCKILAARLGSNEFAQWVEWELNGYPESQATPEYRKLTCGYYGNFMNIAWHVDRQPIPLSIVPEEYRESYQRVEYREGIAKVADFVGKGGARVNKQELVPLLHRQVFNEMDCVGAWLEIPGSEFQQLVSAIKNRILDFVLKIEAENPDAGDAALKSQPVPPEIVRTLVNNFFGPTGNVAQHSQDFSQTAKIVNQSELAKLVTEFSNHLQELNLNEREKQKAEAQIATLKAQLGTDADPVIVRQAGRTLRNVTEGAMGSLLAAAAQPTIWHWIHHVMPTLFP